MQSSSLSLLSSWAHRCPLWLAAESAPGRCPPGFVSPVFLHLSNSLCPVTRIIFLIPFSSCILGDFVLFSVLLMVVLEIGSHAPDLPKSNFLYFVLRPSQGIGTRDLAYFPPISICGEIVHFERSARFSSVSLITFCTSGPLVSSPSARRVPCSALVGLSESYFQSTYNSRLLSHPCVLCVPLLWPQVPPRRAAWMLSHGRRPASCCCSSALRLLSRLPLSASLPLACLPAADPLSTFLSSLWSSWFSQM